MGGSLLKDFRRVCPTSCSYLHPLPDGVHIRARKQSTSSVVPASAATFCISHLEVSGLASLLSSSPASCVTPPALPARKQDLSRWCKHRVTSPWCTRGGKSLQAHPCEQRMTETLRDVGLHVVPRAAQVQPCSLPAFIGVGVLTINTEKLVPPVWSPELSLYTPFLLCSVLDGEL